MAGTLPPTNTSELLKEHDTEPKAFTYSSDLNLVLEFHGAPEETLHIGLQRIMVLGLDQVRVDLRVLNGPVQ